MLSRFSRGDHNTSAGALALGLHTMKIKSVEIKPVYIKGDFFDPVLHFHFYITGFAKRSQSCDATGVREMRENDVPRKLQVRRVGNPSMAKFL